MLTKFGVKNYRGFSEGIEWDLAHPGKYDFNTQYIKDGVIKNGIIYGPNGSGKTNFGLAIFDIINHLSSKMKKPDYYSNFVYAGNMESPVEFDYTFRFGDDVVEYSYTKSNSGKLLGEVLKLNNETVIERTSGSIGLADLQITPEKASEIIKSDNNVSVINVLLLQNAVDKEHYLAKLVAFVDSMLWFKCLESREFIGLDSDTSNIEDYIIDNNLVDDYAAFLKETSGQEFELKAGTIGTQKRLFAVFPGKVMMPFLKMASTGTQALELLYFWMKKLDKASFVFIDEFDAFYHFNLSFAVCKRLFGMDAQVFLSSHNTYLMTNDLLRPDCNFIVNKNQIRPLCDCTEKELRWGHSIEKLYRGGTFSF